MKKAKELFASVRNKLDTAIIQAQCGRYSLAKACKNEQGLSHTVEVLLMVAGAVVVVVLVISLVTAWINNDVFPDMTSKYETIYK